MTGPSEICPNCGQEYKQIGNHWNRSSNCSYPNLTETQIEVITGVLMGDGCINRGASKNPLFQVRMITPEYLNYIDDVLGVYSTGVSFEKTAKESHDEIKERGFSNTTSPDNYSDVYIMRTRSSPSFERFSEWYSTGKKSFDYTIEMKPTVLLHWYVCDGSLSYSGSSPQVEICCSNEVDSIESISNLFTSQGLPEPSTSIYENEDYTQLKLRFFGKDGRSILKYMSGGHGFIPPGFEYKFTERFK